MMLGRKAKDSILGFSVTWPCKRPYPGDGEPYANGGEQDPCRRPACLRYASSYSFFNWPRRYPTPYLVQLSRQCPFALAMLHKGKDSHFRRFLPQVCNYRRIKVFVSLAHSCKNHVHRVQPQVRHGLLRKRGHTRLT